MSSRIHNYAEERNLFDHYCDVVNDKLEELDAREDDIEAFFESDSDDDDDDVSMFSDFSFFSTDSEDTEMEEELDAMDEEREEIYQQMEDVHRYGLHIYSPVEDTDIDFNADPMMIRDLFARPASCEADFRFRPEDLQLVADKLWPKVSPFLDGDEEEIHVEGRYTVPYETGLLILLYRMTWPRRYRPEMERMFCMRSTKLCNVVKTFAHAFYRVARQYFDHPDIFHHRFADYAERIELKSHGAVTNVWGFIDGTLRRTCKPIRYQRVCYSGHKRCHGLKFQSVVTPDGLIAMLYGPIAGSRHDRYMLGESELMQQLDQIMPLHGNGEIYAIYGDPAYPTSEHLFSGFPGAQPGTPEHQWNTEMSRVRVSAEFGFGNVLKKFPYLDFTRSMKIFQGRWSKLYFVAAFFTNLHCCIYGNEVSNYFGVDPLNIKLSLDGYLDLV